MLRGHMTSGSLGKLTVADCLCVKALPRVSRSVPACTYELQLLVSESRLAEGLQLTA